MMPANPPGFSSFRLSRRTLGPHVDLYVAAVRGAASDASVPVVWAIIGDASGPETPRSAGGHRK
jgi:hypothetical protein